MLPAPRLQAGRRGTQTFVRTTHQQDRGSLSCAPAILGGVAINARSAVARTPLHGRTWTCRTSTSGRIVRLQPGHGMKLAVIFSCDARSASSLAPSVSGADVSGEAGDAGDAGGAGDAGDPAARRFPRVGVTAAAVEGVDSALWGPLDLSRQSLTWRARAAGLNERPQCWQLTSSALARALYSPGCPFAILMFFYDGLHCTLSRLWHRRLL